MSFEGLLKRLGVDSIDLYYQHRQDPNTPVEEVLEDIQSLIHFKIMELDSCCRFTVGFSKILALEK